MSDVEVETTETTVDDTEAVAEVEQEQPEDDPHAGLKSALEKERKARREFEKKARELEQQLADSTKTAEELEAEKARREVEAAALAKANERVVRSELRAAAATKVKRTDLLVKVTDLSAIPVDENGDPDADAISEAIDAFLAEYPELAAEQPAKFGGSADQGTKGRDAKPRQLTREDISKMTPEAIVKAQKEGLLDDVLAGK